MNNLGAQPSICMNMYPHISLLLSSISRDTLSEVKIQIQSIPSNLLILQFRNFVKKEISLPYSSKDLQGNHSCSKGRASGSGALRSDWHSVSRWRQSRPWAACPAPGFHCLLTQLAVPIQHACLASHSTSWKKTKDWGLNLGWGQPSPPSMEIMASFALFGEGLSYVLGGDEWVHLPCWPGAWMVGICGHSVFLFSSELGIKACTSLYSLTTSRTSLTLSKFTTCLHETVSMNNLP